MKRQPASGPSGTAGWVLRPAGVESRPLPVLALPDASLPSLYYLLPQFPQLARDRDGRPVLSLSLLLTGRPGPEDDSIFPLIVSGSLACDLTLGLPDDVLGESSVPLFAREAVFRIEAGTNGTGTTVLGEATGTGAGARVGLAANLDQEAARGVLTALNGGESGLSLTCNVCYRTAESRVVIHLYERPAAIYSYLYARVGNGGVFTRADLQGYLLDMVRTGELKAWRVEPNGLESDLAEADGPALLTVFLKVAGGILSSATPDLDPADSASRYELGTRPDPASAMNVRLSVTTPAEACADLAAPLEAAFSGALDGQDAESFIHLSYVEPGSRGGVQSVPRRMRSNPGSRGASIDGRAAPTELATVGGDVVSVGRALTPSSAARPMAAAILASDAVRPQVGAAHAFAVDNLTLGRIPSDLVRPNGHPVLDGGDPPLPHLPVVVVPSAPLWADRADAGRFWYAPDLSLAPVDPAVDPDSSPFQFTFHEAGHDSQGRAVLEGEVLFTLRRGIGAETQAALRAKGMPPASPVPTMGLSVTLSLPVRDDSGRLRHVGLAASVDDRGDIVVARVALLNEYVRVAYGDLAIAGFQAEPARVSVAYTFDAMVPVFAPDLRLEYAGKLARTPVAYSALEVGSLRERAFVDAADASFHSPTADVIYRRETPAGPSGGRVGTDPGLPGVPPPATRGGEPRPLGAVALTAAVAQPSVAMAIARPGHIAVTPIRPDLETSVRLQDLLVRPRYARQTLGRTVDLDVSYPCNTLGTFYRQDLGDRMTSVGCQDSFSLGQTTLRLYELVDDPSVSSPLYKVYRSLSQPGRFLVLPSAYRITRFAPGEGERAYRPVIYMYSSVDAENEANNRCVVMASLQPDVPPWARKALAAKLASLHHSPVVQYVTEIDSDLSYTWSLSGGPAAIDPQAAKLWDGFQVTLSTDLAGGLQLQGMLTHSGIAAEASFKLVDGTSMSTSLVLDLGNLTGPWETGPVETTTQGTSAVLSNRIERGVNVGDLAIYAGDGSSQAVRVDRLLAPGASSSVDLPFVAAEAYPIFTLQAGDPATLTEIASFVEDIHTNVVFVNLIEYGNHNLKRLDLRARLKEVAGSETEVAIGEDQRVGEAAFILPLTAYLGTRTLQFQVTKTDTSDAVTTTSWLEWDLTTRGNVVSLTWALVS